MSVKHILALGTAGAAIATLSAIAPAQAITINFDDIPENPIANGYQGFNWDNFYALNAVTFGIQPSGYRNGMVSPVNVAFNPFGSPASVSSSNPFTFNSVFLTGAWNDNLTIQVQGFLGTTEQYNQTVVASAFSPTLFTFDFTGIDKVTFTSSGGTNAGFGRVGTQFAMDNLRVNEATTPVPVPPQLLGTVFGATLASLKLRKGKKLEQAQA
jgi:hypothetical protein